MPEPADGESVAVAVLRRRPRRVALSILNSNKGVVGVALPLLIGDEFVVVVVEGGISVKFSICVRKPSISLS